jgi:hypothetical protein
MPAPKEKLTRVQAALLHNDGVTRRRLQSDRNIADDAQPARCAACGAAVSHINPGPCRCTEEVSRDEKGAS